MPAKRGPAKRGSFKPKTAAKHAGKAAAPSVRKSMNVMDIVALHPGAAGVLSAYGLHCVGCAFNTLDSLEEGAKSHGLTDYDVGLIVQDLNDLLSSAEPRPAVLTVTTAAAKALLAMAEAENKAGQGLRVDTDERGAFCMEFEPGPKPDDAVFFNADVPQLPFFASPLTLWRIGGATIDHRDGRFKLDLPKTACACGNETCGCGGNGAKD